MNESSELHEPEDQGGGSGAYSILGYEYQIDVSVWLALDLILSSKLAHELVLEPETEEDLEADLEEFEPAPVTSQVPLGAYRLIVQAKRRSENAWTVAGLKALLNHGKKRKSATTRLAEDPNARYLLVTSAGLNGGMRNLRVRRAGIWPNAEGMPASIKRGLPDGTAGRVAVIGSQDEERLGTNIRTLLMDNFRVPRARLSECCLALRSEARARIGGAGRGRWTRIQLEQLIRRHGGYLASSPELDQYVHPTNWPELHTAMRERFSALIVGQSGTGKTMATRKLYEELREMIPGLTRVPITHGPKQIEDDTTEPPVLFDIEDPWGKYDFEPASRPWNDQLSRFFSEARHDRMFVATSRRDVALTTGAIDTVKPWIVGLEAEHYGQLERTNLYRTRIDALPRKLQGVARRSENQVLSDLATPLEIQKFFDALPTIEEDKLNNPSGFISEAIRRAHQNSIEQTVVDQIEARKDVRAATIVWGLLKASEKLSISVLRQIEENLADQSAEYEQGVSPFIAFFVAARNLRQIESTVTYYHPRVEAGIERALHRQRLVARKTLRHLIEILMSLNGPDEEWGTGASARLLAAADRTPDLKPVPSREGQQKIDSWISVQLAKGGGEFERNLQLAASVGSQESDVSEVARFLRYRPDLSFGHMNIWMPPEREEAWYSRMRANTGVKALLETFIRELLPSNRDSFGRKFVTEVGRLASNLTGAFLSAAEEAVHYGVISNDEVISEGALNDINGFEKVIDAAVEVRTASDAEIASYAKTYLSIVNGEYNEEYVEYISENEDGWTAGEFIDAYVVHVRSVLGWQRIASHKHSKSMLSYWLRAMSNSESLTPDEIAGAFFAAYDTEDEDSLWSILSKAWTPSFSQQLLSRIMEGHAIESIRLGALSCMAKHAPAQIAEATQILLQQGNLARLTELAIDLEEWHQRSLRTSGGANNRNDVETLLTGAPALFRELNAAAVALSREKSPSLSLQAIELLKAITDVSETVRVFRLNLDNHFSVFVADDVHSLLSHSMERDIAVVAIKAAIRHRMSDEIQAALSHRFSNVAALALEAFASPLSPPLPAKVLDLVSVKGNPVRRMLVDLLDSKPHIDHLSTLLVLAHDKWSRHLSRYGEDEYLPVAQAAVRVISKLGQINSNACDELYRLAIDTGDSNLRYAIFELLVRSAESSFQPQLFELAVSPGKLSFRRLAAHALMVAHEQVVPEIVAQISPKLLMTRVEDVASRLLLLLCFKGSMEEVLACAEALATNSKRRVLLLLAIWAVNDRSPSTATQIASMLPSTNSAVSWALDGGNYPVDEQLLEDLGDVMSVGQVLQFMQPKTNPT